MTGTHHTHVQFLKRSPTVPQTHFLQQRFFILQQTTKPTNDFGFLHPLIPREEAIQPRPPPQAKTHPHQSVPALNARPITRIALLGLCIPFAPIRRGDRAFACCFSEALGAVPWRSLRVPGWWGRGAQTEACIDSFCAGLGTIT
ncbi:hypothetical protein J1614_009998 [Plenodomus biglobosus]|nr:hypothetical protein J1614_009998 [Plenodomus biglobosus]